MAGEEWREKLQIGRETTYGTGVAATRIVYVADPAFPREREERVHRFATGTRERVRAVTLGPAKPSGKVTLPCSADELLEWLLISIQGNVTPTTPSGGTLTRLWQFIPSTVLDSMTIEYLDGANLWRMRGVYGSKVTFSGSAMGENTVTVELFGKAKEILGSLTGSLAERTPTFIEGWQTRLFVDAFGATPGTTQVSGTLINWTVEINLNLGRKYTADNTLEMKAAVVGEVDVTAKLTFEAAAAAATSEYSNWDGETARLVRLEFGGREQIEASPTNEVQSLSITGSPTGGTFTLSFRGQTTGTIAYNATAAQVQSALEALGAIGSGNVACTGGPLPGTAVTITFQNVLGGLNVPQLAIGSNNLTGGTSPAPSVSTTTPGVGYKRTVQVDLPGKWTAVDTGGMDEGTRVYEFNLRAYYDPTNAFSAAIRCYTNRTAAFA
jgi:hypothetical protein